MLATLVYPYVVELTQPVTLDGAAQRSARQPTESREKQLPLETVS